MEYVIARSRAAHPAPRPKVADVEAGVAEDLLGLPQPLALDLADEGVGADLDVLEHERRGVRQPDPVLVLGLGLGEALRAPLDHEPGGAARGVGQDRVSVGHPAVADPLLAAGDPVAGHHVAVHDRRGLRPQRTEVAAGLRLGRAVRVERAVLGDLSEPARLLLLGGPDRDRVGAEERREHAGGHPQVDTGHRLADPVDVEGAGAHPAVLLGDEDQLDPQLLAAHQANGVDRALVEVIQLKQALVGQVPRRELPDGLKGEVEGLAVETDYRSD